MSSEEPLGLFVAQKHPATHRQFPACWAPSKSPAPSRSPKHLPPNASPKNNPSARSWHNSRADYVLGCLPDVPGWDPTHASQTQVSLPGCGLQLLSQRVATRVARACKPWRRYPHGGDTHTWRRYPGDTPCHWGCSVKEWRCYHVLTTTSSPPRPQGAAGWDGMMGGAGGSLTGTSHEQG